MTDYPDFQSLVTWHDTPFAAYSAYPLSGTDTAEGTQNTRNFQGLAVNIGPAGAAGCTLNLYFFTDETAVTGMGTQSWNIPSGVSLSMITPMLGNYLKWYVTSTAAAAEDTAITLAATNTPVFSTRYWGPQNYRRTTDLVVPASGQLVAVMPFVAQGPGYLYFKDRTGSNKLSAGIYDLNLDASLNGRLAWFASPLTELHEQLTVPGVGLAFVTTNADSTVGHTCDYSFTVDGR